LKDLGKHVFSFSDNEHHTALSKAGTSKSGPQGAAVLQALDVSQLHSDEIDLLKKLLSSAQAC